MWWNISLASRNKNCEIRTLFKLVNEAESTFRPLSCQLVSVLSGNLGHNNLVISTRFAFVFFFQISLTTCLSVWLFLSLFHSFFLCVSRTCRVQRSPVQPNLDPSGVFCISASVSLRARPPESLTAYFKLPEKQQNKPTNEKLIHPNVWLIVFMLPISGGGIFTSGLYKSLLRYIGETFFSPPVFFCERKYDETAKQYAHVNTNVATHFLKVSNFHAR